jgi:hypothetical protein
MQVLSTNTLGNVDVANVSWQTEQSRIASSPSDRQHLHRHDGITIAPEIVV